MTDFVAGTGTVMDLLEVMEEKVCMVGWAGDSEEERVVVTVAEDTEVSERGSAREDAERVPEK